MNRVISLIIVILIVTAFSIFVIPLEKDDHVTTSTVIESHTISVTKSSTKTIVTTQSSLYTVGTYTMFDEIETGKLILRNQGWLVGLGLSSASESALKFSADPGTYLVTIATQYTPVDFGIGTISAVNPKFFIGGEAQVEEITQGVFEIPEKGRYKVYLSTIGMTYITLEIYELKDYSTTTLTYISTNTIHKTIRTRELFTETAILTMSIEEIVTLHTIKPLSNRYIYSPVLGIAAIVIVLIMVIRPKLQKTRIKKSKQLKSSKCEKCGSELPAEAEYCDECGTKQQNKTK